MWKPGAWIPDIQENPGNPHYGGTWSADDRRSTAAFDRCATVLHWTAWRDADADILREPESSDLWGERDH